MLHSNRLSVHPGGALRAHCSICPLLPTRGTGLGLPPDPGLPVRRGEAPQQGHAARGWQHSSRFPRSSPLTSTDSAANQLTTGETTGRGWDCKGEHWCLVIFRPQNLSSPFWVHRCAWKPGAPQASAVLSAVSSLTPGRSTPCLPETLCKWNFGFINHRLSAPGCRQTRLLRSEKNVELLPQIQTTGENSSI